MEEIQSCALQEITKILFIKQRFNQIQPEFRAFGSQNLPAGINNTI